MDGHIITQLVAILLAIVAIIPQASSKSSRRHGDETTAVAIPRIMHHIYWQWDKSKVVNENRKSKWQKCRQTCIDKTPGYEYMLWDDVMIEKLIIEKYHWLMPMYKSYDYEVQRSDVAR